jgi:hypothetical protein
VSKALVQTVLWDVDFFLKWYYISGGKRFFDWESRV